jgi:predicted DNA-binding transcriptional regulator
MTFEEMQAIIEQILQRQLATQAELGKMLEVQRDLQEGQLNLLDNAISALQKEQSMSRRIEQLIGYSISAESDRLTLQEQIERLQQRVQQIEKRLKNN